MKHFLTLLIAASATILHAQPGVLDPSFGKQGIITGSPGLFNLGETVITTKSGRVLIGTLGSYKGFTYTFKIDALLQNGSVDSSFGENGSA